MLNYLWKNKLVHGYVVLKKIKMWSAQHTAFDHIFDHLQTRTTWKQCSQEHPKAPFLDTKAPKITRNYTKNLCRTLRDTEYASSNILSFKLPLMPWNKRSSGLFTFFEKMPKTHFDHMFWPLMKIQLFGFDAGISLRLKSLFPFFTAYSQRRLNL